MTAFTTSPVDVIKTRVMNQKGTGKGTAESKPDYTIMFSYKSVLVNPVQGANADFLNLD